MTAAPVGADGSPRVLRRAVLAVVLLSALLQLAEIGRYRTIGGDETYYMEAAYTMLTTGDWLVPRYVTGELRFEKPIATYWAIGLCTSLLGFSLWAARLHSVILSLLTLPYVWGLARVTLKDRKRSWLAVLAYVSLKSVHGNAHQGRTDVILSFFVAAAVYHFARALFEGDRPRRDVVLGHAFAAGAILTKGLAGVLFTYLPLAVFALLARKRLPAGRARSLVTPWGLVTLVAITAPWFVYVLLTHGEEFQRIFFHDQVTANVRADRPFLWASMLSYGVLFLRETFPWWPVLLLGLVLERDALRRVLRAFPSQWLLLGLWLGLPLLVLSLGHATRGRYLLPAFPAVALLVAALLGECRAGTALHRGLRWMVHLLTAASGLLALYFLGMQRGPLWPHDMPWVVWPVLALLLAAVGFSLVARRLTLPGSAAALGALSLALLSCSNSVLEQPAPLIPVAELGREVLAERPAGEHLAVVGGHAKVLATTLLFATRRRPEGLCNDSRPDAIVAFLRDWVEQPGDKLILLREQAYGALPADLLERTQVVAERSALLEHGLRPDAPAWLFELPGARPAVLDTVRLLAVVDPPR